MKTVIFCGGMGTRFSEETDVLPKPMVRIGGKPILEHICNIYSQFGLNEFVLALGYKGEVIKDYFLNYHSLTSDITVDLTTGKAICQNSHTKDWKLHLIDTGEKTLTGTRLSRLEPQLKSSGTFMVTYGDGLADIDLAALLKFHRMHGKLVTVTAVTPIARFGTMTLKDHQVVEFREKTQESEDWVNGGFFVMEPGVFNYLKGNCSLETTPLENLTRDGQLMAYTHHGFWQCMDTKRDHLLLEEYWAKGNAPWTQRKGVCHRDEVQTPRNNEKIPEIVC